MPLVWRPFTLPCPWTKIVYFTIILDSIDQDCPFFNVRLFAMIICEQVLRVGSLYFDAIGDEQL